MFMKNLLNLTALASGLLASSLGAHAESLRVRVPFAFTASGTKLPAGEYSIREVAGNPTILLIQGSNARAMVFARVIASGATTSRPVIFEDEGSEGMVLVSVRTSDALFELSTSAIRTNLAKNAALAIK
jgi:hypothetical protein